MNKWDCLSSSSVLFSDGSVQWSSGSCSVPEISSRPSSMICVLSGRFSTPLPALYFTAPFHFSCYATWPKYEDTWAARSRVQAEYVILSVGSALTSPCAIVAALSLWTDRHDEDGWRIRSVQVMGCGSDSSRRSSVGFSSGFFQVHLHQIQSIIFYGFCLWSKCYSSGHVVYQRMSHCCEEPNMLEELMLS